jgi:hypothetical protein
VREHVVYCAAWLILQQLARLKDRLWEVFMRLTDVSKLPVTKDDELTSLDEQETARWAANLPADRVSGAIAHEWGNLQQVPSYVEGLIAAHRGLLEGIATQS